MAFRVYVLVILRSFAPMAPWFFWRQEMPLMEILPDGETMSHQILGIGRFIFSQMAMNLGLANNGSRT